MPALLQGSVVRCRTLRRYAIEWSARHAIRDCGIRGPFMNPARNVGKTWRASSGRFSLPEYYHRRVVASTGQASMGAAGGVTVRSGLPSKQA